MIDVQLHACLDRGTAAAETTLESVTVKDPKAKA